MNRWIQTVVPSVLEPQGRCSEHPAAAEYVDRLRAGLAPLYPELGALWAEEGKLSRRFHDVRDLHGDESTRARQAHSLYLQAWDRSVKAARLVLKCSP